MIKFTETGYTPANYQALVDATGLSNVDFYHTFNIPKPTFYQHKSGSRTMDWQSWQTLLEQVEEYLKNKDK